MSNVIGKARASIRGRILCGFLLAGLLPLVGALYVYETLNSLTLREAEFKKVHELGGEAARQVAAIMDRAANELDAVASNPILIDDNKSTEEKLEEMRRLVGVYHFFSDLTLFDKRGFVLGSTMVNHPGHRDRSRWLRDALESGAKSVTSPYKVMGETGLYLTVYNPLGKVGSIHQVVAARLRFDEVWNLFDEIKLGSGGELVLLDEFGNVLAGKDKTKILSRFDDKRSVKLWLRENEGYYTFGGESCLFTSHPLAAPQTQVGRSWLILCFEPVAEVDALLAKNRLSQWLAALGGLGIVSLLGLLVSNLISRPLELAAEAANAVKQGDFEVRMPQKGPVEIQRLAEAFNLMIEDINDHRTDLESKVASRTERLNKAQEALKKERASLADRVEMRTRELRAANKELARTARMKDEFLAGMSHELRTPLNAVLGLTESLEEGTYGELNDRQLETLSIIDESGRHLLALINDILDVAKAESGEMQLDIMPVDIVKLCESGFNLVKQAAMKKNLQLETVIDPQATVIMADERRLKQILVNLLSNSVKFTPSGSVGLEVRANADEHIMEFVVWDTGIGIPEDQFDKLFQPFVQLDSGLGRQYEGTGLGLALVYNLTEIHGGCVSAESEMEKGTRITITIPWRESKDESVSSNAPLKSPARSQGTILLADDNETELMVLARKLNREGFEVYPVSDGSAAVDRCRQINPDLIILDVQMPGMDGLEATHHLRAEPNFRQTPIIGLTALNTPGDIRRIHEAGMTDCVLKPVRFARLTSLIELYLNNPHSCNSASPIPNAA